MRRPLLLIGLLALSAAAAIQGDEYRTDPVEALIATTLADPEERVDRRAAALGSAGAVSVESRRGRRRPRPEGPFGPRYRVRGARTRGSHRRGERCPRGGWSVAGGVGRVPRRRGGGSLLRRARLLGRGRARPRACGGALCCRRRPPLSGSPVARDGWRRGGLDRLGGGASSLGRRVPFGRHALE